MSETVHADSQDSAALEEGPTCHVVVSAGDHDTSDSFGPVLATRALAEEHAAALNVGLSPTDTGWHTVEEHQIEDAVPRIVVSWSLITSLRSTRLRIEPGALARVQPMREVWVEGCSILPEPTATLQRSEEPRGCVRITGPDRSEVLAAFLAEHAQAQSST